MFVLIHLQAAIALGLLMCAIAAVIIFIVFPIILIALNKEFLKRKKLLHPRLNLKDRFIVFFQAFTYSLLAIALLAFSIYQFLNYLTRDLYCSI
ncbi:hypothetical protein CNR22_22055 [Sphingobacteriaceae bacterium]|nr:hypothetical protein CNR22_22055 [Sphingobacteriaceae bacterium]